MSNIVAMAKKKKKRFQKNLKSEKDDRNSKVSASDFHRIEFFRNGFTLVPDPADRSPGVALLLKATKKERDQRFCSCAVSKRRTCEHILKLVALYKTFREQYGEKTPEEAFRSSLWHRLAAILADGAQETAESVRLQFVDLNSRRALRVLDAEEKEKLHYFSQASDAIRFIERMDQSGGEGMVPRRGDFLKKLAALTLTDEESYMAQMGFKTIRQVLEESFWYRLAYHCFREFGDRDNTFHPAVEEASGEFTLTFKHGGGDAIGRMVIPRRRVKSLLSAFREIFPNQRELAIHPVPLKSLFKISANKKMDLQIKPIVQVLKEDGEARFFAREDLERFRYGDLIYIKDLGVLAELEPSGKMQEKFAKPTRMVLKKSQVPSFLQEFGPELREGAHIVDASVRNLKIYTHFDKMDITPAALKRGWCWLSVKYGFGNSSISLAQILQAKKEGQRFVSAANGWVDCQSEDFESFDPILNRVSTEQQDNPPELVKLSRMELLRLKAATPRPLEVIGKGKTVSLLKSMLDLRPAHPLPELKGLASPLRPYQKLGVEWLLFLFENGLGGLLCDDMGLGKTHEVMALMLALREKEQLKKPFLVVCPTTVLSHWQRKISIHAPGLKAAVFHGGQRNLQETLCDSNVLLTSYGILRNDIERLEKIPFPLAVFDEIQNVKNPQTLAYEAARNLRATVKIGLTGTPIENNLGELKALFDLTVPGYLGTDEEFSSRYGQAIEMDPAGEKPKALARLISPFTLRRLKRTVLEELPEKIEDIHTCALSDDQIKLYRDAVSSRGKELVEAIKRREKPIPYMHIFSLLTLLKQICDHPALIEGKLEDFERYQSGKWELFKELITESLESGQKVIIYSQFLGMIQIIESFLQGLGVHFVTLTGASRKRGEIISRFNEDPACRVYVGSLKAGGTGIDLVAASVVIHYDRWWNAAKEDQATDRVHRIGQRRGVQVFKLVTEGTLEEKISAMIEKKRNLMESIIREDNPVLLKTFSREELIAMLSLPS